MSKLSIIEEGQTVYVSTSGYYKSEPNLVEYLVTRVNSSSFYAILKNSEFSKREERFNKRTMISKSGMGYNRTAYLTAEEYWDMINKQKSEIELRNNILEEIKDMDYEKLSALSEWMKTSKKN